MNPEEEVFIMGVKIVIMAYQVFFLKKKRRRQWQTAYPVAKWWYLLDK